MKGEVGLSGGEGVHALDRETEQREPAMGQSGHRPASMLVSLIS